MEIHVVRRGFRFGHVAGVSEFVVEFVLLFLVCGWTTLSMTLGGLGGSMFSLLESGGGGAAAAARPPMGSSNADGRQSTARSSRGVEILLQNQRRRPDGEIQGESHRERVAIAREHAQARNGDDDRRRHLGVLRLGALGAELASPTTKISRRFTTTITGRDTRSFSSESRLRCCSSSPAVRRTRRRRAKTRVWLRLLEIYSSSCGVVVGVPVRHFHRKQRAVDLERALRRGKLRLFTVHRAHRAGYAGRRGRFVQETQFVGGGLGADPCV